VKVRRQKRQTGYSSNTDVLRVCEHSFYRTIRTLFTSLPCVPQGTFLDYTMATIISYVCFVCNVRMIVYRRSETIIMPSLLSDVFSALFGSYLPTNRYFPLIIEHSNFVQVLGIYTLSLRCQHFLKNLTN